LERISIDTLQVCTKRLRTEDFQNITYKPRDLRAEEEHHYSNSSTSPRGTSGSTSVTGSPGQSTPSVPTSIYAEISDSNLNQIKSIDLPASYGTKIDTLARHIIWLREADPGAKSIVFSQYTDFLTFLSDALHTLKIGSTSIQQNKGIDKFCHDPSIECFLLDAKTDSSGLNLVCATHVFLCEPLINPAIELQAIARVHRIGQMRATTVWMQIIADSVEEAIYELSVGRRLAYVAKKHSQDPKTDSHGAISELETNETSTAELSKSDAAAVHESALDVANSHELQRVPISRLLVRSGKGGGEVVDNDDLWKCLFGKPRARSMEGNGSVSGALQAEVDRHLRAEAAAGRAIAGQADGGAERS
jgi:E3 ubiquitin-protein ligase SHPRH